MWLGFFLGPFLEAKQFFEGFKNTAIIKSITAEFSRIAIIIAIMESCCELFIYISASFIHAYVSELPFLSEPRKLEQVLGNCPLKYHIIIECLSY